VTKVSPDRRGQLKRPSQARSIATFTSILDASTDIIVERGVQGLNTNVVAERAGVNIGTVYHYFPDKTAILVELFRIDQQRRMTHLLEKLREVSDAPDLDQWADDIFGLTIQLRNDHPATAQLRRAFRAVPELVELDRKETDEYLEFFASRLQVRFTGVSKDRARAAARILIEVTATILDISEETGGNAEVFLAEGLTALKSYIHTLERSCQECPRSLLGIGGIPDTLFVDAVRCDLLVRSSDSLVEGADHHNDQHDEQRNPAVVEQHCSPA
jgi:AcrR family transcriptional regulator